MVKKMIDRFLNQPHLFAFLCPFSLTPHSQHTHPRTDQWSAPATTPVAPPPPPPPADAGAAASAAAAAAPPPSTAARDSEAALAATAALLDQAGDLVAKASATAASARARLADITATVARRAGVPSAAETPARGGGARGGKRTAAARDAGARASAINSKGLRHFSLKVRGKREREAGWNQSSTPGAFPAHSPPSNPPQVCEKVESKGVTSYNEVADELVAELREAEGAPVPPPSADGAPPSPRAVAAAAAFDEKNIRRRVYDALNVLMAMNIIVKDRKQITWRGLPLPGGGSKVARLRAERDRLRAVVDRAAAGVTDAARQAAAFRALILRNGATPASALRTAAASVAAAPGAPPPPTPLPLPFILLSVRGDAAVEVQISDDNRSAAFDFKDAPFRVVGGEDVLYTLGLDREGGAGAGATPTLPTPAAATPRRGSHAAPLTPDEGDAAGELSPMLASPAPAPRRRSGVRRGAAAAGASPRGRRGVAAAAMDASPTPRAASPSACGGATRPSSSRSGRTTTVAWPVAG